MLITDFLEKNAREYPDDVALVELNPEIKVPKLTTWKEYELIQPLNEVPYRTEITWGVFDEKANRVANFLIARGIVKGDKVAILLMNCLDWLPIYFGILRAGAIAVPLNFRYSADEIEYCVNLAEADILIFGHEFIGRVEEIADNISHHRLLLYYGASCPTYAEDFISQTINYSSKAPNIEIDEDDYGAIYFSSGTTGFPKAILHKHRGITHAAVMEQKHHGQQKDDTFLCIPPLYHTGAKMHWFGSLVSGGKAVLLRGTTPEVILNAVSKEHCTVVWLLVPWAQDILDAIDNGSVSLADYELDDAWEINFAAEYRFNKMLAVSLGGFYTDIGSKKEEGGNNFYNPYLNSFTYCGGFELTFFDDLTIDVGGFYVQYFSETYQNVKLEKKIFEGAISVTYRFL